MRTCRCETRAVPRTDPRRQEQKAHAGHGIVTARARRSESAGSPIAFAGTACSDGGVTRSNADSWSIKQVHVTRNTHRHATTNNAQLTRTSWRFVSDAILLGHRRAHWWVPAGHPRYTVGRRWVAHKHVTMCTHTQPTHSNTAKSLETHLGLLKPIGTFFNP